eukprot:143495-Chlamydomonas_euryale.AAC.1
MGLLPVTLTLTQEDSVCLCLPDTWHVQPQIRLKGGGGGGGEKGQIELLLCFLHLQLLAVPSFELHVCKPWSYPISIEVFKDASHRQSRLSGQCLSDGGSQGTTPCMHARMHQHDKLQCEAPFTTGQSLVAAACRFSCWHWRAMLPLMRFPSLCHTSWASASSLIACHVRGQAASLLRQGNPLRRPCTCCMRACVPMHVHVHVHVHEGVVAHGRGDHRILRLSLRPAAGERHGPGRRP